VEYDKLPILSNDTSESARTARTQPLSRREVMQRLFSGVGAVLTVPVLAAAHPIHRHFADLATMEQAETKAATADWKPEFLEPTQDRLLVAIAERMVPGSRQAQVNRIIDLLLSVDTSANQKNFIASLSMLDGEAEHKFSNPFPVLGEQQQDEVLAGCASGQESAAKITSADPDEPEPEKIPVTKRDHFENLKGWIVGAYYSTEIGMRELGWTEDFYFEELPGCTHAGNHAFEITPREEQQDKS
jgi:Gluconate 2-dehydrogenase subunit 3